MSEKKSLFQKIKSVVIGFIVGVISVFAIILRRKAVHNNRNTITDTGEQQQRIKNGNAEIENGISRIENIINANDRVLQEIRETKQENENNSSS